MPKMRFSQRKGITSVRVEIQRESMDGSLRNKLWSVIVSHFIGEDYRSSKAHFLKESSLVLVLRGLWVDFLELPIDTLPSTWNKVGETMRERFFKWKWHEVYDFIEALAQRLTGSHKQLFISTVNSILENEMSAYRFVGDEIGEITSATEIETIESAITDTQELLAVNAHLREALAKLTDRANPDYRNSIKESISAVEAICQLITKDKKAPLGEAIKKMREIGVGLHPALEKAWISLYGYTSNEGGIRHALSDLPQVTFGTAKYMLVSCSAFVNYLLE